MSEVTNSRTGNRLRTGAKQIAAGALVAAYLSGNLEFETVAIVLLAMLYIETVDVAGVITHDQ